MSKFRLVLLIHSHQPVGNFDGVFEKIYQPVLSPIRGMPAAASLRAHGPALFRPASGMDRSTHHPEFFDHLREMAGRGQIEMVGGGFYEPILISIPPEDQARAASDHARLHRASTSAPRPPAYGLPSASGSRNFPTRWPPATCNTRWWTTVHFLAAGFEPRAAVRRLRRRRSRPHCAPVSRPEGAALSAALSARRRRPSHFFAPAPMPIPAAWPPWATTAKNSAPGRAPTNSATAMAGWIASFPRWRPSSDWLETMTPGEYMRQRTPRGPRRPAYRLLRGNDGVGAAHGVAQRTSTRSTTSLRAAPTYMRFLRGGQWRGFFSKYSEANLLHKKMLHVSNRLRGLSPSKHSHGRPDAGWRSARTHLLRAQCNDAYWHGIFGGVYAPHLRTELWRELVRAETVIDEIADSNQEELFHVEQLDFDADGTDELYVTSPRMAALVEPADGGTISALDFRPSAVTLINSMQRRLETYHAKLQQRRRTGSTASRGLDSRSGARQGARPRAVSALRPLAAQLIPPAGFFAAENIRGLPADQARRKCRSCRRRVVRRPKSRQQQANLAASHAPKRRRTAALRHQNICLSRIPRTATRSIAPWTCAANGAPPRRAHGRHRNGAQSARARRARPLFRNRARARHRLRWAGAVASAKSKPAHLRIVDEWQDVAATIDAPKAHAVVDRAD